MKSAKKAAPKKAAKKKKDAPKVEKPWMKDNKYAIGNDGGRPPHFETPEQLRAEIDNYFEWIKGYESIKMVKSRNELTGLIEEIEIRDWERYPEYPSRTGLTLYLGFSSLSSLDDYKKRGSEFSLIITRAQLRVQAGYEQGLNSKDRSRGAQFALSNMGWSNRQDVQNLGADGKPADPAKGGVIITTMAPNVNKI